jgi:16S rRNA (guanine966-N2)-methyltransferase
LVQRRNTATNQVRISAGEWRSRLLRFPNVTGLRPTPDRVRQTVFNWLGQDMHGLSGLDLFAGTGVMGFEALSRGAISVVMVEKSPAACKALQQNQQQLNASQAHIHCMDAQQFLKQTTQSFDLIFLDPPYHQGWLPKLLNELPAFLAPDGRVYAEAEYALQDEDTWQVIKHGKAGNVHFHLLKLTNE